MNIKTNKELLFGHSILHHWAKYNFRHKPKTWTKTEIRKEHTRLVKIMKKRKIKHNTPLQEEKEK